MPLVHTKRTNRFRFLPPFLRLLLLFLRPLHPLRVCGTLIIFLGDDVFNDRSNGARRAGFEVDKNAFDVGDEAVGERSTEVFADDDTEEGHFLRGTDTFGPVSRDCFRFFISFSGEKEWCGGKRGLVGK